LIDEQKRLADAKVRSAAHSDLYSHDSKQTWVQAVFACLKSGNRKPLGRKAARQRLRSAISRSEQAYRRRGNVPNEVWIRPLAASWFQGIGIAIAILALFLVLFLLSHDTFQPRF
jgi:hypothetical protein